MSIYGVMAILLKTVVFDADRLLKASETNSVWIKRFRQKI